jgi:Zinc finger, C3HC4 type (RING finger)
VSGACVDTSSPASIRGQSALPHLRISFCCIPKSLSLPKLWGLVSAIEGYSRINPLKFLHTQLDTAVFFILRSICKDCTVQWPAKMVPDTYNTKKAGAVNVCRSCDWLCNSFRLALLNGNRDEAVALHATGNINLTSPFNNVKGEIFYPVHAAALGGSLELLRWLVDDHCSPIKSVRLSGLNNTSSDRYTPIVTSKGRSLLGIAMANENVHMVRYLIVNKHLSIEAEKDITPAMVLRNFEKVLCLLPDTEGSDTTGQPAGLSSPERPAFSSLVAGDYNDMSPIPPAAPLFPDSRTLSQEARDFGAILQHRPVMGDGENNGGENHDDEECIICYDAKIDCVATPCGHQMCCLKCSNNFRPPRCPVCAQECSFLRVFR